MFVELVFTVLLFTLSLGVIRNILPNRKGKHGSIRMKTMPGPVNLPYVGSLPSILFNVGGNVFKKSSFELLNDLKRIWGSPIGLKFGKFNAVLVDDMTTAHKLMISEDWANRLDDNPLWYKRAFDNHYGLLISNGESWKEMRKFVHKTLAKNGFGRSRSLEMIHEIEILNFFEYLNKLRDARDSRDIVNIQGLFNVSTFNILWKMVAGSRFSYHSEEIINLMKLLEEFARGVHPKELGFLVFPWLRHFQPYSAYNKFIENHKKMQDFFLSIINERRKSKEYIEKQETFIDVFLYEIDQHKAEKVVPNYYTDEQLAMVLVDLFVTGFVPTASCLEFLVMFMIIHPEIQRRCHEEIEIVIGRQRFPSINDNDKMPYTQAVCLEVLRHVTLIPMTTRSATRDTQIDDFFIPKGSIAAINLHGIHHDKNTWTKPNEFNPDRFLDENGVLCNHDLILPFGTGKRICPAEVYARVSTFTYFTYLIQRYSFERVPTDEPPDTTPNVGMGNYAKPFRCMIRERQQTSAEAIAEYVFGDRYQSYYNYADEGTLV